MMQVRSLMAATTLVLCSGVGGLTVARGAEQAASHQKTVKAVTIDSATGDYGFLKKTIKIKVGTKVIWTNPSDTGHNVTAISSNWHIARDLEVGATVSHTFKKAGVYRYQCTIHPGMTGKIVVVK